MRQRTRLVIAAIAVMVVNGALSRDAAADCQGFVDPNIVTVAGGCSITGPIASTHCPVTLAVTGNLDIAPAGSIRCDDFNPASSITITVSNGDLTMQAGSKITAENTVAAGGVDGGAISITVPDGDFTMQGSGGTPIPLPPSCVTVAGACVSSSDVPGGGGKAGNITIKVGNFPNTPAVGVFTMEPGSAVLANSQRGSGGAIVVSAGLRMEVDGVVRSFGGISGTGAGQPNGGGPISLDSGCALEVSPDGVVSSEGEDPGADLVHLAGCEVTINGLVRSAVRLSGGHVLPAAGNKCNASPADHPLGGANAFTACVEIWGNNVTINSILPNLGVVSADGIRANRAWIDIFATKNVTINNDFVGRFSVHANSALQTNNFGGLITIKAQTGTYASSGLAIQANSTAAGSDGGDVIIQSAGNVALSDSTVEARGASAGTTPQSGTISARSFAGSVLGDLAAQLIATGTPPPGGPITLQGCTGVAYNGVSIPAFFNPGNLCVPTQPTLPAAAVAALNALAPICVSAECGGDCPKRGRKFNDANNNHQDDGEPGLTGWQICAFDSTGTIVLPCQITGANGAYEFKALTCGQTFTFCEVLQDTWTQTFPNVIGGNVASCVGLVGPGGLPLGPIGYKETLVEGQASEGNDFGNFFKEITCKEDPDAVCTLKVGAGGFPTVQAAYNAAANGDVICVFTNTEENVVLGAPNGNKSLTITQCTSAQVTAADNSLPVWKISSTGALTIIGPDAKNGSIGWLIEGSGHDIKAVRATGASQVGIKITGSNNKVSFNSVSGSPVGVRIEGTGNDVRGGTVSGNAAGVQLGTTASGNSFGGATVRNNAGVGILVQGPGNTLNGNQVNGNTGVASHGIHVTATAPNTVLKSNKSGNPENGGAEYQLDVDAIDQGGNRADGIQIPKTTAPEKCPLFAAAGTCE